VTNNIKNKSIEPITNGMVKFPKKEETPNTPKTLYIFEPKTLPRAKSTLRLMADKIPTTNSGSEVPKATNDIPIIASGILN